MFFSLIIVKCKTLCSVCGVCVICGRYMHMYMCIMYITSTHRGQMLLLSPLLYWSVLFPRDRVSHWLNLQPRWQPASHNSTKVTDMYVHTQLFMWVPGDLNVVPRLVSRMLSSWAIFPASRLLGTQQMTKRRLEHLPTLAYKPQTKNHRWNQRPLTSIQGWQWDLPPSDWVRASGELS